MRTDVECAMCNVLYMINTKSDNEVYIKALDATVDNPLQYIQHYTLL